MALESFYLNTDMVVMALESLGNPSTLKKVAREVPVANVIKLTPSLEELVELTLKERVKAGFSYKLENKYKFVYSMVKSANNEENVGNIDAMASSRKNRRTQHLKRLQYKRPGLRSAKRTG